MRGQPFQVESHFFPAELAEEVALALGRDVAGAVPGDRAESKLLEQLAELRRLGRRVLDLLEAVGAHRIVIRDHRALRFVRIRSHEKLPRLRADEQW